jgi:hypothetical protein
MDKSKKLDVKTGGVINFTTGTNYVMGHWNLSVEKSSNVVCTVMWHIIRAAKESDHPQTSNSNGRRQRKHWLSDDMEKKQEMEEESGNVHREESKCEGIYKREEANDRDGGEKKEEEMKTNEMREKENKNGIQVQTRR